MTKKTTKPVAVPKASAKASPAVVQPPLAPQPSVPVPPPAFLTVFVDGEAIQVPKGATVMDACTKAGKEIPHFCYHERLSIAGNCRMCLVEVEGMPKPVASCHWPAAEGMKVRTASRVATDARKGTMEFLLINHPLDCPICDQGGECTLQDLSLGYGGDRTHYHEAKRAVDDKDIGAKIKTVMTRCIHCTRCIRFATEIAGVEEMGATGRGEAMQVGTYVEQALQSELAGNMIDLCPVGALTNKPYAYTARPWELVEHPTLDVLDAVGGHIRVDSRAGQVMRVVPREADHLNEEWATDAARYSYDALSSNRLTTPMVAGIEVGWPQALAAVKVALRDAGRNPTSPRLRRAGVAGVVDDMHCAEDVLAFRSFVEGLGGKVGLAGADVVVEGRGANVCHTPFADWDKADAVLLIGCNLRMEAPLLNVRVRRAVRKNRIPVAVVGAKCDLTYAHQHLSESLSGFEKHAFLEVLAKAERPLIVVGQQVLGRADAEAVVAMAAGLASRKGWNGLNVLHGTCGRVTALDMGVAAGKGEIVKAWEGGKLGALIVYGEGTLRLDDLRGGTGTLIYVGTHLTDVARGADIVLPAAAWSEKAGLWANGEGRVQEAAACVLPPLNAKEDWKVWRALSGEVGSALPFDNLGALRVLVGTQCTAYTPAQWGKVVAVKMPALASGKIDGKALVEAVPHYYLRSTYLRQSANMLAMQAEVGTAKVKRAA
jgi:NADH-quinone oxidoreductase subunit G